MKEVNPIETEEYEISKGISDYTDFNWWESHKKSDITLYMQYGIGSYKGIINSGSKSPQIPKKQRHWIQKMGTTYGNVL